MKIPKPKSYRPKKRPSDISTKAKEWEQKQLKNQKFKNSSYFGKPLKEICPESLQCPVFVESVIQHVEGCGEFEPPEYGYYGIRFFVCCNHF